MYKNITLTLRELSEALTLTQLSEALTLTELSEALTLADIILDMIIVYYLAYRHDNHETT